MEEKKIIERAISRLANSLRIYGETFHSYQRLYAIDKEEAINNLDRAFEQNINAFHALYDVSKNHVKYFDHGDTSLIIAIRNSLHHANHDLFHSLLSETLLINRLSSYNGAALLVCRHPMLSEGNLPLQHYIKIQDIYNRLDPNSRSIFKDISIGREKSHDRFQKITQDLSLEKILEYAKKERFPLKQIYIDLMPIFVSATIKAFKKLDQLGFQFNCFDAKAYYAPFTSELEVNLQLIKYGRIKINDTSIFLSEKNCPLNFIEPC